MRINKKFSISSSSEILTMLAVGKCPHKWRIFLGICGWGINQLNQEIQGVYPYNKNQSWLLSSADIDIVFDTDHSDQWSKSIERSGTEFAQNFFA